MSSFPKHEKISVLKSKKVLKKFNLSAKEKSVIIGIIKNHSDLHLIVDEENKNLTKEFNKLIKLSKDFSAELVIMVMADTIGGYLKKTNPQKYNFKINFCKEKLEILV